VDRKGVNKGAKRNKKLQGGRQDKWMNERKVRI
jgi:hypothetical protein